MKLLQVKLSQIVVGERTRGDYGDVNQVVESIKQHGIIQPLAVMELEDDKYQLLAGGRRLRACSMLQLETVPVRVYEGDLSEDEVVSIELEENVCRLDLTWDEQCILVDRIHRLQSKISKKKGEPSKHLQKDTAKLLNTSEMSISRDLNMAKALKHFPELAQCKTKDDAMKVLKTLGTQMERAEFAKEVAKIQAETPVEILRKDLISNYIVGDFYEKASEVADGIVSLVELDPPYAIGLDKKKKVSGSVKAAMIDYQEARPEEYEAQLEIMIDIAWSKLSSDGWVLVWYGIEPWHNVIVNKLRKRGFRTNGLPCIWTKHEEEATYTGQTRQPDIYLGNSYELFLYARKGGATLYKKGRSNEFSFKPVLPATKKIHPTEKPIELYQEILSTFLRGKGDAVMSGFLGSGNINLAASNLGISCFGYDLSDNTKNAYVQRVMGSAPPNYKSY